MKQIRRCGARTAIALLWFWAAGVGASGIEASVDRTRVVAGEALSLTLTAPGDSWGIPDLGPLAPDFDVESRGQSTKMSVVNGFVSSTREWRFLLTPKRAGELSIPAIKIGDLHSEPIALEVLPASEAPRLGTALPVMVEGEVDQESPYVQSQVLYRARVLTKVNVREATLEDPHGEGVVVERLGDDRSYETYREGQRYKVIERRYALFPQRSGRIEIQPPVLSGAVPEPRRGRQGAGGGSFGGPAGSAFERFFGRDPFEDMGTLLQRTRPIKVRAPVLPLDVRPRPEGAASPWLPAESLQMSDTWSSDLAEVHVGEPVTRTVAITAQGLSAAQLPELLPEMPDGVKLYPDRPRTETRAEGDDLIAVREVKYALVPSQEGEVTLPEIRLTWWDTGEDRERVAVLPARVVQVLPARTGAARSPRVLPETKGSDGIGDAGRLEAPTPSGGAGDVHADPGPANREPVTGSPSPEGYWPWVSAGLAGIWVATLLLWMWERARRRGQPARRAGRLERAPAPSLSAARSLVRRACDEDDPRAARGALLEWAAARWPVDPPRRLESLANRLGGRAAEALRALDRHLYAPDSGSWDGRAAWGQMGDELLRPGDGTAGADSARHPLPPLYPTGA